MRPPTNGTTTKKQAKLQRRNSSQLQHVALLRLKAYLVRFQIWLVYFIRGMRARAREMAVHVRMCRRSHHIFIQRAVDVIASLLVLVHTVVHVGYKLNTTLPS